MGKEKYGIKPLPIVHPLSQRETSRYKDIGFVTHKTGESFCEVLLRYMSDTATNSYKLSEITGISVASVYWYQRYDCEISLEHTAAICIGLRLHPMRSRYLFSLTHISLNYNIQRDIIILHYLYGCAFSSEYSLSACNRELQSRGFRPLTSLGLTE